MYEDEAAKPSTNESDLYFAPVIIFHVYILPNKEPPTYINNNCFSITLDFSHFTQHCFCE
jgi:hypothetical protein